MMKKSIVLWFDDVGNITESIGALIARQHVEGKNIRHLFPCVDSIFEQIICRHFDDPPLVFERVSTTFKPLPGFYDFIFSKKEKSPVGLLNSLTINDLTEEYRAFQKILQRKNEALVQRTHGGPGRP
ncbi:MAG: hypothetical protein D6714_15670 [Bacteroidetes bacterium]|nr:MAG: hypothetical protein D6714_15670 [Bacteroidota bacterium]